MYIMCAMGNKFWCERDSIFVAHFQGISSSREVPGLAQLLQNKVSQNYKTFPDEVESMLVNTYIIIYLELQTI